MGNEYKEKYYEELKENGKLTKEQEKMYNDYQDLQRKFIEEQNNYKTAMEKFNIMKNKISIEMNQIKEQDALSRLQIERRNQDLKNQISQMNDNFLMQKERIERNFENQILREKDNAKRRIEELTRNFEINMNNAISSERRKNQWQIEDIRRNHEQEKCNLTKELNNKIEKMKIDFRKEKEEQTKMMINEYFNNCLNLIRKIDFKENFEQIFNLQDKKLFESYLLNIELKDDKKMKQKIMKEFNDKLQELSNKNLGNIQNRHYNVLLQGFAGTGKSVLIKAILGDIVKDLIKDGVGLPVTSKSEEFSSPDSVFRFIDSRGIELQSYNIDKALKETKELVLSRRLSGDSEKFIHSIWFCMNPNSNRFQKCEISYIKELRELYLDGSLPIKIVITQAYDEDKCDIFEEELKKQLKICGAGDLKIFRLLAKDYKNKNDTFSSFGIKQLLKDSFESSKTSVKSAYYSFFYDLNKKNFEEIISELKNDIDIIYFNEEIRNYELSINLNEIEEDNKSSLETFFSSILSNTITYFRALVSLDNKVYLTFSVKDDWSHWRGKNKVIINNYLKQVKKFELKNYSKLVNEIDKRIEENKSSVLRDEEKTNIKEYFNKIKKKVEKELQIKLEKFLIEYFYKVFKDKIGILFLEYFESSWKKNEEELKVEIDKYINITFDDIKKLGNIDKFP